MLSHFHSPKLTSFIFRRIEPINERYVDGERQLVGIHTMLARFRTLKMLVIDMGWYCGGTREIYACAQSLKCHSPCLEHLAFHCVPISFINNNAEMKAVASLICEAISSCVRLEELSISIRDRDIVEICTVSF